MQPDYGSFAGLVNVAGTIIAMGSALALTFRGRSRWEPSEEDVPRGAQKVSGLLAAGAVALLWVTYREQPQEIGWHLPVVLGSLTFGFLLLYGFLIGNQTYEVERMAGATTKQVKIIGGFWLTAKARSLVAKGKTRQDILAGAAYQLDRVWPRPARSLAKLSFVVGYTGLVVCGTVALGAVAIRVGGV
ncbi:hypothetical protein [Amycolatopsis kentuckyensis]|uniref:hypothetical protein n=1 Tax=Amycolatopsis kentuckyensis TaxID=218823 RepID=UPI003568520E